MTDREFLEPMQIQILGSKKIPLSDISADIVYIYIMATESGYQILVTKVCNEGRISYILLFLNVSAVSSKRFTC